MAEHLSPARRRIMIASVLLGVFVVLDLALFGWLIFRSLSKREVERVLLETRQEAEGLAERLAGRAELQGEDLYTVAASEREIQTYIDSILKQRKFVQTVEVTDSEGRLVFRGTGEATFELEPVDTPVIETAEAPSRVEVRPFERQTTFPIGETVESLHDLSLPIGELGFLRIGISQGELEKSVDTLRGQLVQTTVTIAALTITVLLLAYIIIWRLWVRGQKLEEQARESERMAYIGTLASGLAHEIRNPLNSLNLNMQMLEEEMDPRSANGSRGRLMSITRDEIHRLERLVTEFLLYAKPPPLDLEVLPAVELVDRCHQILSGELGSSGARLTIEDHSGGAEVRVDVGQMSQLLLNLVQNSLAALREADNPLDIVVQVSEQADRVVISVEDNGVGMTADQQEKMFELFYSTRKGGTGLGLAVVQRIARAHEADLEVESAPRAGTRIHLKLPAARSLDSITQASGTKAIGEGVPLIRAGGR